MPGWLAALDRVYSRPGDFERYLAKAPKMLNRHFIFTLLLPIVASLGCARSKDVPVDVISKAPESIETNDWLIRAQVFSPDGQPTNQTEVATFWSANGRQWDENGVFQKVETEEDAAEYWNDEGQMEPYPRLRGTLSDNGQFTIKKSKRKPYVVLALNDDRTHGGLGAASPDSQQPITIQLERLVRVFGKIRCAGQVPGWTNVYVYSPGHLKEVPD